MFQTSFKCFKHVYNIQNTFIIFETLLKYLKRVENIRTALYSKRVAYSRKKKNTRQVSATVVNEESHAIIIKVILSTARTKQSQIVRNLRVRKRNGNHGNGSRHF